MLIPNLVGILGVVGSLRWRSVSGAVEVVVLGTMLVRDTWWFVATKIHFSKQVIKHDENIFLHKTIATNGPYQRFD